MKLFARASLSVVLWLAITGTIWAAATGGPFCAVTQVTETGSLEISLGTWSEQVGLIGVEFPNPLHPAAIDLLQNGSTPNYMRGALVGQQVWLEYDSVIRDPAGLLRAYVWIGQPMDESEPEVSAKMLNAMLLWSGQARHRPAPPNVKYDALFAKLQAEAQAAGRGIWHGVQMVPVIADPAVYITPAGTKYHRDGCRYLGKSKTAVGLAEAKARGYTPCGVCKPPE